MFKNNGIITSCVFHLNVSPFIFQICDLLQLALKLKGMGTKSASCYILFAFCRDQCIHHALSHFWVELGEGFNFTHATTVVHNKN